MESKVRRNPDSGKTVTVSDDATDTETLSGNNLTTKSRR
jgi:hypothetical protein